MPIGTGKGITLVEPSVEDLTDVVVTSRTVGDTLVWNGTHWVNQAGGGSGTIGGSIANGQIAFGSGTNTIQGTISAQLDTSGNAIFNSVSANAATLNGSAGQVQVLLGTDSTAYYAEDSLGTKLLDIGGSYDSQDAHAYFGAPFQVATIPNNDASDQITLIAGYVAAAYSALTITQTSDFGNGSGAVTYFMPDSNHGLKVIAGAPMEYFSSDPMQFDTSFSGSFSGSISLNAVDGLGAAVYAGLNTLDDGTGNAIFQTETVQGQLICFDNMVMGTAGKGLYVKEGTNGRLGTTTLVSGTKAITISGLTTSSRAFVQLTTPGGTMGTAYKAVCTANTLTITAVSVGGTTVTTDTSTLNYFIVQPS